MPKNWLTDTPDYLVKPPKRQSTEVRLGLATMAAMVGGLGLMVWVAAGQSKERRPEYLSREDCEREWNDRDCEPTHSGYTGGTGGGSGGGGYRGPSVRGYTIDQDGKAHPTDTVSDEVPRGSRAWTVSRGGFGSAGGRFGASS